MRWFVQNCTMWGGLSAIESSTRLTRCVRELCSNIAILVGSQLLWTLASSLHWGDARKVCERWFNARLEHDLKKTFHVSVPCTIVVSMVWWALPPQGGKSSELWTCCAWYYYGIVTLSGAAKHWDHAWCESRMIDIWLILPVVICLSQRLSHARVSTRFSIVKLRMAH